MSCIYFVGTNSLNKALFEGLLLHYYCGVVVSICDFYVDYCGVVVGVCDSCVGYCGVVVCVWDSCVGYCGVVVVVGDSYVVTVVE